jgi:hypothetical protein
MGGASGFLQGIDAVGGLPETGASLRQTRIFIVGLAIALFSRGGLVSWKTEYAQE